MKGNKKPGLKTGLIASLVKLIFSQYNRIEGLEIPFHFSDSGPYHQP
jgi:hypothetical protein